jgi:hypothetical protein
MRIKLNITIGCLILAFQASAAPIEKLPQELANQVQRVLKNHNKEDFENLYLWDGVDAKTKDLMEFPLNMLITQTNVSVEAVTNLGNFKQEFVGNGITYRFNLPIRGVIKCYSSSGNISKIPYGQKGQMFYLAGVVKVSDINIATNQKAVSISVSVSPSRSHFDGIYTASNNGVTTTNSFSGNGNHAESFWSQKIETCRIFRESTNGWTQLIISESGNIIYDSQRQSTNNLVFERPGK